VVNPFQFKDLVYDLQFSSSADEQNAEFKVISVSFSGKTVTFGLEIDGIYDGN
jgi:hypothetical protein